MLIREVVERRLNNYENKEDTQPSMRSDDVFSGPDTMTDPSVSLELQESTLSPTQKPPLERDSLQKIPSQERKPGEEGELFWQNDQTELKESLGEDVSQPEESWESGSQAAAGQ